MLLSDHLGGKWGRRLTLTHVGEEAPDVVRRQIPLCQHVHIPQASEQARKPASIMAPWHHGIRNQPEGASALSTQTETETET